MPRGDRTGRLGRGSGCNTAAISDRAGGRGRRLLFKDTSGNRLWSKDIKTKNATQYSGTNIQGKVLRKVDIKTLINRAKRKGIKKLPSF